MDEGLFVTQFGAPDVADPRHVAFDYISQDAQAAAAFAARPGGHNDDTVLLARHDVLRRALGLIVQQRPRAIRESGLAVTPRSSAGQAVL